MDGLPRPRRLLSARLHSSPVNHNAAPTPLTHQSSNQNRTATQPTHPNPQFFGEDWGGAAEIEVDEFEAKLARLTHAEREALAEVMAKIDHLREIVDSIDGLTEEAQAELFEWQRQQVEQQRREERRAGEGGDDGSSTPDAAATSSSSSSSSSSRTKKPEPYPGASPAMQTVLEVLQGGETILVDSQEEEQRRTAAARERERQQREEERERVRARQQQRQAAREEQAAAGARRQWGDWGTGRGAGAQQQQEGGGDMDSRVDSAMKHSRAIQEGVQDWGPPPSRHFQVLKE